MHGIKFYRNLNKADRLFGLELLDWLGLCVVFPICFWVNPEGLTLNAGLMASVFAALYGLKRGKPDGYLLGLLRFLLAPKYRRTPMLNEAEVLEAPDHGK